MIKQVPRSQHVSGVRSRLQTEVKSAQRNSDLRFCFYLRDQLRAFKLRVPGRGGINGQFKTISFAGVRGVLERRRKGQIVRGVLCAVDVPLVRSDLVITSRSMDGSDRKQAADRVSETP